MVRSENQGGSGQIWVKSRISNRKLCAKTKWQEKQHKNNLARLVKFLFVAFANFLVSKKFSHKICHKSFFRSVKQDLKSPLYFTLEEFRSWGRPFSTSWTPHFWGQLMVSYQSQISCEKVCFSSRVARWYIFKPKISIWVIFGGPWNGKGWYILLPFGI
jgi:hypothetical protein